jgi:hypothetical protein
MEGIIMDKEDIRKINWIIPPDVMNVKKYMEDNPDLFLNQPHNLIEMAMIKENKVKKDNE